jgi:hypothetical protein
MDNEPQPRTGANSIVAHREGDTTGTHQVTYESAEIQSKLYIMHTIGQALHTVP